MAQLNEEISEYENLRAQRIAENKEMFKKLFPASLLTPKRELTRKIKSKSERSPRSLQTMPYPMRRNPSRHCRRQKGLMDSEEPEARDITSDYEPEEEYGEDFKESGFIIKLWKHRPWQCEAEERKRSPRKTTVNRDELLKTYSALTEDDLVMVAEKTSDKRYDQLGTTCHQCRQKTDDLKTLCHSQMCFGVRGQFCGPCLRNRYGEDAKVAIMDQNWICPPCRSICNCSFCMPKRGRRATGILIHVAKEKGYQSVKAFLGD